MAFRSSIHTVDSKVQLSMIEAYVWLLSTDMHYINHANGSTRICYYLRSGLRLEMLIGCVY